MDTVTGCDLPISWAFPAVSGLAGMRWFTLPLCCLPRTHGQLPASCLPLCVLALPSRQLPGDGCQKSSFLRKGQVTSSHLCQYLCFLFNLSVLQLEKTVQLNAECRGSGHFRSLGSEPGASLSQLGTALLVLFCSQLCGV